jgi:hypothetical protein
MPSLQQAAQCDQWQPQDLHSPSPWDKLELLDRILTAARHVLWAFVLVPWSISFWQLTGYWSPILLTGIFIVVTAFRERHRFSHTH